MRALIACAILLAVTPALAQDEGDAPDVVAPPAPEVQAKVAVFVLDADGEPVPSSVRGTLQVSMERALETDERLSVIDADTELARRAGEVPTDLVSEARGLLTAGEELLKRGRVEPALAKLEAASEHLAEVLAWTSKQELARAQFLLGAAYAMKGKKKEAVAEFVALLAWRPDYAADPEISPKAVLPQWDKVEAKVKNLEGGSVEITSSPEGAMAYVDGRFVGFTPTVVEGLPAAIHYVTVRMHGRVRSVTAVRISDKAAAQHDVRLERTPGADDLERAVEGLTREDNRDSLRAIAKLLEVQHVAVLVVPSGGAGPYQGRVYDVEKGEPLATASVELGERDPEEAFAELVNGLYGQISFEPPEEPEPPKVVKKTGKPVWKKWWFWGSLGTAVAAGIALPLVLGRDTTPELSCPTGHSCGVVVLDF